MKVLGITGGIAMGKSTVTKYLGAQGIPVLQSDEIVARLYSDDQKVIAAVIAVSPQAVCDNKVDKAILRESIIGNPQYIETLEKIIHPAVIAHYNDFIAANANAELIAIEVPLLYEASLENMFDSILVVYCSDENQRQRIMDRNAMTDEFFNVLNRRQMDIRQKISMADFAISTDGEKDETLQLVDSVIKKMKG